MDVSEVFSSEDHEMKKPRSSEPKDRLSELPDPLILIILSFLPTRQAIRTTVLSKRWKDLWTTVPCLDFSDDINDSGKLQDFVNWALSFWKGNKIVKFKIDLLFDMSLASSLDSWVRFAMEKEVEEIYLGFMYDEDVIMSTGDAGFGAPQCLYSCSSIRKLSLLGCDLKINGDLQWSQLKSLRIDGFRLSGDVINHILSCTQLEVLKLLLKESYVDLNIQSCSLKKLTITKYLYIDDDPATDTVLIIWAPNLEILVISGVLYSKCRLMNVSSLTDATLDLYVPKNYNDGKELLGQMLRQIFQTIHHVEKVTLSDSCIKVIGVLEKKYLLSSSSGVKFLKLNASSIELDKIVDLLKIFPKLKMLAIEHTDLRLKEVKYQTFRENLRFQERRIREPLKLDAEPTSFLLQLRRVEITWFLCETSIFPLIELLLKYASTLEKMVIRARRMMSLAPECFFLASQKLLRMPRSSPTAEVILCENDIILFHVKSHCQLEKGSSVP